MVFELGFSFVIQQLAAHECVHLELGADGSVSGDAQAHARLASALQLSVRWYTVAAAAMAMILAPLGVVFFSRYAAPAERRSRGRARGSPRCSPLQPACGACPSTRFSKAAAMFARWRRCALRQAVAAVVFGLGAAAAAPRPLLAGDGDRGPDRDRPALCCRAPAFARRTAASSAARRRHRMEARGVALPVAHRRELDVLLLHGSGLHSHPVRAARRRWKRARWACR